MNSSTRSYRWRIGARIVATSAVIGTIGFTLYALASLHSASLAVRRITARLSEQYPDPVNMSPDGSLLLLKSLESKSFNLHVVDRATGKEIRRHHAANRQMVPAWRPDSREVAFLQEANADHLYYLNIWKLSVDSTIHLDAPPTVTLSMAWSPDGKRI